MKKTLIALALAATAVSGSAMAWTSNGLGGTMEFGGTLTPKDVVNPWEVQVGPNMDALNGSLKPNEKVVKIMLSKAVPLLGIRVADASKKFTGVLGIAPQIDYKNALDISKFAKGEAPLTLKVVKKTDASVELGSLKASMLALGVASYETSSPNELYASGAGVAFHGGIAPSSDKALGSYSAVIAAINGLSSAFSAKYNDFGYSGINKPNQASFSDPLMTYSGMYGAGLKSGSTVTITLTNPATADMAWKASFPITVSYQ
ncbi:fimbrial protein [Salmonella enterica]|nr:fimbrial protein [Salmonella enterica]